MSLSEKETTDIQNDPICPHCKREPCVLRGRGIVMGGVPIMVLCCDGCRKIISAVALPMPPMQQQQPARESLLVIPGREN